MGCPLCQGHQHCDTLRNSTFDIWLCLVSGVSVGSTTIDFLFSTRFSFSTRAADRFHITSAPFSLPFTCLDLLLLSVSKTEFHQRGRTLLFPWNTHRRRYHFSSIILRMAPAFLSCMLSGCAKSPSFTHVTHTRTRARQGNARIVSAQAPDSVV